MAKTRAGNVSRMTEDPDLLVAGGRVVLADGTLDADVAVRGGRVLALGERGSFAAAREIIDATGKLVLPGLVDSHVHIRWPFLSDTTRDDFLSGTVAAAFGGTTTIIDFAVQKDCSPDEAVARRRELMDGKAVVDFALTTAMTQASDENLDGMRSVADQGSAAFKAYMIYRKRGILSDDAALLRLLGKAQDVGRLLGVHAENAAMAEYNEARFLAAGKNAAEYWPLCKPNLCEAEAVNRAIFLARSAATGLYFRHLSTREGIAQLKVVRAQGLPIYAETQYQYMVLNDEVFQRPDGFNYICSPPLRSREDAKALWAAVAEGTVSVISSDHCAFDLAQKRRPSFDLVPNGLPGVETRAPVVFTAGVMSGRISENKFVEVMSTNPAKLFGLYPRKGTLAPGSDADIVVIDPAAEQRLSARTLHMVDWTPYEGMLVKGVPVMTISRGEVVIRDGRFMGKQGRGEFLKAGSYRPLA